MAYTLVSAIAKPIGGGGRWVNVDISNMSFNDIFNDYLRVIATLSNPFDATNTALDLASIEFSITDPSITFAQFLINNGSASLPTTTPPPTIKTLYAEYADGFNAGYQVTPISLDAAIDSVIPVEDKKSLKLTDYTNAVDPESRPINWALFEQSCMVSVNGYWHFMAADSSGAIVRDGMTSCVKSKRNTIGIYSLANLGKIQYIDLQPSMIYKQDPTSQLNQGVYINVGQDLTNKTVLLVIAGYLHVIDDRYPSFSRVGDQLLKIDWPNFPYVDRYFEQVDTIDLSSLNLTHIPANDSQVATSELMSDATITAYCSLSQSFIVLLDNTEVFVDYQDVTDSGTTGVYIGYEEPKWPLVTGHGKVSEWWSTEETGQWGVCIADGRTDTRTYNTTDLPLNSVAANRIPAKVSYRTRAQYLKLGTDVNFN